MEKNITLKRLRCSEKAALVAKTAALTGYDKRTVYRVIAGDSVNEVVFTTYMTMLEELSKLPDAVRKLIPL